MNSLITSLGVAGFVALVIALVCVAVVVVAGIMHWVLMIKYHVLNKVETKEGWTAYAAARSLLDANGLNDVEIKQMGFWSALFLGNRYSVRKKTIYLRKNIINKKSITAVGVAVQKVGLAILDKQGDKKLRARAALQPFTFFAPTLFIPFVIIGLILDFVIGFSGLPTLIASAIGVLIYAVAFVFLILNIPVEKKGNALALDILQRTSFMDEEEVQKLEKLFKTYLWVYVLDFIVALIRLIQMILKLLLQLLTIKMHKSK